MARRVKDHEKLDESSIRKVIGLLNASPPISKKEACSILNIAYNTTRLAKILEDFTERQALIKRRKDAKRGKAADKDEIREVISDYLSGEGITNIAKRQYRSTAFIENLIEQIGLPEIRYKKDRRGASLLPEQCIAESFEKGEIAWSATEDVPVQIIAELSIDYQAEKEGFKDTNYEKKYGCKCYSVYVATKSEESDNPFAYVGGHYSYMLAYDLGKLQHLQEYGIDLNRMLETR